MKPIGEVIKGISPDYWQLSNTRAAYTPAYNESLADAIERHYKRLCENESHDIYYPDGQTRWLINCVAEFMQQRENGWLVIFGPKGLGKSLSIRAAIQALKEQRANRIPDYYRAKEIRRFAANGNPLFESICVGFSFVAIDDLGGEFDEKTIEDSVNDFGTRISPLKTVLEERLDMHLRTIITTNVDVNFIEKHYGGRVADRIGQKSFVKSISVSGPSFRDPQFSGAERMKRKPIK